MKIEAVRVGDVLLARVEGELDLSSAGAFREALDARLNGADGAKHLVLNLARLTFMDSSGLGAILGRYRRISERGGRLVAADVPTHITRLLALSGLQKTIVTYATEAEALRNL